MAKVDWIKVNINIFSNRKIKTVLKEREGDTYFRIWIQILTIAGECNRNGGLYISDNQPFTIKDFTNITGKSSKTFTKILQKFINLGMLIYKNDTYFVKNWSKYQSADKLKKMQNQIK
jgi:predicted phage replisome organizer